MTNEEKARELANDYFRRGQLGLVSIGTESAGYDCAMKAMRWKDAQFAEQKQALIDKACAWIDTYSQYRSDLIAKHLDENFIKEFRKTMEDKK